MSVVNGIPPSSGGTSGSSGKTTSGQNVGEQSSDSSDKQFNCFRCGGEHHTQKCKVTSPTADQKAAGKAAKEAFATAKRNKNINTNSTGITQNQLTVEPPDYAPEDVTSKLCSYRNFG